MTTRRWRVDSADARRVQTVYLDSTILSFLHDRRPLLVFQSQTTRRWWRDERGRFRLFLSEATLNELSDGNYPARHAALRTARGINILPPSASLGPIVREYIQQFIMPRDQEGDAAHLAYASFHGLDYLLTWNCKHLANADKFRHIRVVNARLGLRTPEIVTPLELFQEN